MTDGISPQKHEQGLGHIDELTGLPNRRWLNETLQESSENYPGRFGVIVIDLDGLKSINDDQGHAAGDSYIQTAAYVLQSSVRSGQDKRTGNTHARDADAPLLGRMSDKRNRESNATRIGGDEFIVVIAGINSTEELVKIQDRLQDRLAVAGVQASAGAAKHEAGQSAKALLEVADKLMYVDKRRRKISKYTPDQLQLVRSLKRIRELGDIALHDLPALEDFIDELE